MILYDDELQISLRGGIGLCYSETISFDGRRHPLAAVWQDGGEIWFDSYTADARVHLPLSSLLAARDGPGKIKVRGIGSISFAEAVGTGLMDSQGCQA